MAEHAWAQVIGGAPDPVGEHFQLMAGVGRLNASTTADRLAVYAPNPEDFILKGRYKDPWPREETKDQKLGREVEASMREENG